MTKKPHPNVVDALRAARHWAEYGRPPVDQRARSAGQRKNARLIRSLRRHPAAVVLLPLLLLPVLLGLAGMLGLLTAAVGAIAVLFGAVASQVPCLLAGLVAFGFVMRGRRLRRPTPPPLPPPAATTSVELPAPAPAPVPVPSTDTPLVRLPTASAAWLVAQRHALPEAAQPVVDDILSRLQAIEPQLKAATVNPLAVAQLRSLLESELPTLVSTYRKVPDAVRRKPLHGHSSPQEQLVSGLHTICEQLGRMHELLAAEVLEALAVHQRYLDLKYKRDDRL